jgi:SET domain-containing protein
MTQRPAHQRFAVDVGPSSIDGQGAFAAEAIPAWALIGAVRGELVGIAEARARAARNDRIMIVELSTWRALDFSDSADTMRYANHSCKPNARLMVDARRVQFYAMRDIAVGEEITVMYGDTHHGGTLRCRCGALGCVRNL